MSTHTAGPWVARNHTITAGKNGVHIAQVGADATGSVTANASLIAAAPELLAALEEVYEILGGLHSQVYPKCKGGCPDHYALDIARAAIAKAKARGQ